MEKLLCPSTMCMEFDNIAASVKELDEAGVDIFHNDIMDGSFVPNFTLGINDVKTVRRNTKKLIDCHLMMEKVSTKVDWFIDAGADIIYVHPESDRCITKTLMHIRERGKYAGIVIDPDIPVEMVSEMLRLCDYVMVMTVHPGFAGQKYLDFTREKVCQLAELKKKYGYKLIIDGACSPAVIKDLSSVGADGFVLGTSALFGKGRPFAEIIRELRAL